MNLKEQVFKNQQTPLLINAIAFLVICLLCFLTFWNTGLLSSGLNMFINDHLMVSMQHDIRQLGLWSTLGKWMVTDYNIGRFQPFYYIQGILLTKVFGVNATLWFVHTCFLASVTVFSLFLFARLIGMPILIACIFPALAFVGPQAIMWAQPSYPQVVGTFFLAIALPLSVIPGKITDQFWNIFINALFLICVLLASLSKESYIIFIPALIAIRIWGYSLSNKTSLQKAIRKTMQVNIVLFSIMALELLYIFFVIGVDGMGNAGIQEETFQISNILSTIATFSQNSYFELVGIAFVLSLVILLWHKVSVSNFFWALLPVAIIALLIISPQIFLYTKSGIHIYYSIPATIGSALLIGYFIYLLMSHSRAIAYFLIGLSAILVFSDFQNVLRDYSLTAQNNYHINALLQETEQCTAKSDPILVALNPRLRYEASLSLRRVLNYVYDRQNLLVATYGLEGTDFYSDTYENAENFWSFIDPQAVADRYDNRTISTFKRKRQIAAVIVFDGLDEEFFATSQAWFKPNRFEKSEFPINFASASLYCKDQ